MVCQKRPKKRPKAFGHGADPPRKSSGHGKKSD